MFGWNLGQMGSSAERGMVRLKGAPARSWHPAEETEKQQQKSRSTLTIKYKANNNVPTIYEDIRKTAGLLKHQIFVSVIALMMQTCCQIV